MAEQRADMETYFTETTRLRDSTGVPDPEMVPASFEEFEYVANGELPSVLADDPPPFSFEMLFEFLDRQRIVWLNSDVFLLREYPNNGASLQYWIAIGGYARCFCLGFSKEDSISVYERSARGAAAGRQTAAFYFLVDLFCLSEGDTAFFQPLCGSSIIADAVLSRFVSQRLQPVETPLSRLEICDFCFSTAASVQDLTTLSEASAGRVEIKLHRSLLLSKAAEDAFISFLQGAHGPTEMDGFPPDNQLRVLSQGLPGNTRLRKLEISLYVAPEDVSEFAQGLRDNEGLQELSVTWSSRTRASADSIVVRSVCEALVAHPALQTLVFARIFRRRMSLRQQTCRAQYIQQLLASNTVLVDVRLDDEDEDNIDDGVFNQFLWPHLGRLRFRGKFNAVMHDTNQIKLLAPALEMLLDTRDDINLAHFFVTVNQGTLVEHICANVADRAMV